MQFFFSTGNGLSPAIIKRYSYLPYLLFLFVALYITGLNSAAHWKIYGNADQDLTYSTFESLRHSLVKDLQFPQFNPFSNGGTDFLANPQAPAGSVLMLFIVLFGSFYGFKIILLAGYFMGMAGAYVFLKKVLESQGRAMVGALMFAGLSYFNWHLIFAGHSNFIWLFALPWIANAHYEYFILQNKRWQHLLVITLIYFQMIVGGAPFIFLYTAIFHTLVFALTEEKFSLTHTGHFAGTFVFAIGLSLWKLIPSVSYFVKYPRHLQDMEGIQPGQWLQAFRDHFVPTNTTDGWHEMAGGSNWILLALALIAMYFTRRRWWVLGFFLLLVWFTLGNYPVRFNPWYFLHKYFPLFSSMRTPSRAVIFVHIMVLFFSLKIIPQLPYALVSRIVLVVLCFWVIGKSKEVSRNFYKDNINSVYWSAVHQQNFEQVKKQKGEREGEIIASGRGILNSYEPMELPVLDYSDSVWIKGGTVKKFSCNKIIFEKTEDTLKAAIRNFDGNWKANTGGVQIDKKVNYLLLTGVRGTIELKYENRYLRVAALASLLFVLLLPLWLYRLKKNRVYVATVIS